MRMDKRPMTVSTEQRRQESGFAEVRRVLIQAAIIALVIRTFLFQPFNIPSGSMKATLLIGEAVAVGLAHSVASMRAAMDRGRARARLP